jgi:hypothetical protein
VPPEGVVRETDYLRHLELAETWASDPIWNQQPDVVEYALFDLDSDFAANPAVTMLGRIGKGLTRVT